MMLQNAFFSPHELTIFWSATEKTTQRHFFPTPPPPFPGIFCNCNSGGICIASQFYVQLPSLLHRVKQRLLRNRPGSDAATSRNFLRERLQEGHSLVQTSFTEPPNRSMISVEKCWSVTVSDFQAWTYTILNLP